MKRFVILISIICLGAVMLRAQETDRAQTENPDVHCRIGGDCGCQSHPANNYSGLNSLRARLANPSWNGKPGTISTGLKLDDGRIKPLVNPGEGKNSDETMMSSATFAGRDNTVENPYLEAIARGEVSVGPPLFIFFRVAGSTITDSLQQLNVNAAADIAIAQNLHARIIGAADSMTGTVEKNDALAKARAEHVASLMKSRGVPEERIEILSQGGTDSYVPMSANRNCRIELYAK